MSLLRGAMVEAVLERSHQLKQALIEFVLDAEAELATSLEAFTAARLKSRHQDMNERNLVIDTFITEGKVGADSPLDLFLQQHSDLSESDRQLIQTWHRSFIGLFAITQVLPDGFELMNWLTAKQYRVKPNNEPTLQEMSRFQPGEILLTRIAPVTAEDWMFSGPCTSLGKLGKPKLAVAIGNFKQAHQQSLYSDAPELLAEAWRSVERYYQYFVDFFGSDEVTLPGYQLSQKLNEFQEVLVQKNLALSEIEPPQSSAEAVPEDSVDTADVAAMAEVLGADANMVSQLMQNKGATKMVMPKVELPAAVKKAEQVTVLADPRWGQIFLPTYSRVKQSLAGEDAASLQQAEKLIRQYLEDPAVHVAVWQRLAQAYPDTLEKVLQAVLDRPGFTLASGLMPLLQEFNKPLAPELPEIASVPAHLHNLFQTALVEVSKAKAKEKPKAKSKGFGKG